MYCPICDEKMDSVVYNGRVVYLCYDCDYMTRELTPAVRYAKVSPRAEQTDVSRSAVYVA